MVDIKEVKEKIIQGLNLEDLTADEIEDDMVLFGDEGLGLDSVDAIEMTLILEKEFGVKITNMAEAQNIFVSSLSLTTFINDQQKNK